MSSIVIAGDTSGTVTLQAPAVAGTTTLTLPATSGTIALTSGAVSPGGSTTQVQYNNAGAFGGISGVTTDGTRMTASTTIGVGGATPSTSGAGITFPATQSASTNANTLDDYEEGTFTPTLTGDGFTRTYNTQYTAANYIKVGRMVTINVVMLVSSQTGTYNSAVGLFNLPFTGTNVATSMRWGTFVCRMSGVPSNTPISKICTAQLLADNLGSLGFYYYNAGTTTTDNLIDTTGWSGYQIGFTVTYVAD
jgi:hypothetical protein